MKFKGSYVALVTPFDENDNVNFEVLANLIDFHLKSHTDRLVVLGTTAEAATMSQEEKDEVVKFVVKKVNHKIPVIVGSGSNSTKLACLASKRYEELGADALLIITKLIIQVLLSILVRLLNRQGFRLLCIMFLQELVCL